MSQGHMQPLQKMRSIDHYVGNFLQWLRERLAKYANPWLQLELLI